MTLKVSIKVRGPTSQQYILSKATIYLEYMKGHLEVVGYRWRTMRDKALEPAYMFPMNRREPGSQERAADLEHNSKTSNNARNVLIGSHWQKVRINSKLFFFCREKCLVCHKGKSTRWKHLLNKQKFHLAFHHPALTGQIIPPPAEVVGIKYLVMRLISTHPSFPERRSRTAPINVCHLETYMLVTINSRFKVCVHVRWFEIGITWIKMLIYLSCFRFINCTCFPPKSDVWPLKPFWEFQFDL